MKCDSSAQPVYTPLPSSLRGHPHSQACQRLSECQQMQVHILMVPLVGLELPAEAAAAVWKAFGSPGNRSPLALHSIVVMSSPSFTLATDFLPVEPLAPSTALQLLQGKTPGRIRLRQLSQLPSRQTFEVAATHAHQGAKTLSQVTSGWDLDLAAGSNDCHTYTNALVQQLTSITNSLKTLGII
ncbi:hypothetical protein WJX74_007127 [Apatococcus lobatus]|uniref:Uncharacterized protein n=1 Tax=Apatococcus lobatus TaxID=904363 RepID=A0AAW1QWW3_9CHLO